VPLCQQAKIITQFTVLVIILIVNWLLFIWTVLALYGFDVYHNHNHNQSV